MNEHQEIHGNSNNQEVRIMDKELYDRIAKKTDEELDAILLQSLETGMRFHPYLSPERRQQLEEESKMSSLEWLKLKTSSSQRQTNEQNERKTKS
tara:strand:- start:181 stop:465 length:285 start_codon:yes stop_codon:yes gene_type:complete